MFAMRLSTIDKILKLLDYNGDECSQWNGATRNGGYGHVSVRGIFFAVHRLVWEILRGPIPKGKVICHHCDNPLCSNIRHLFVGTIQDNVDDMWRKGRGGPRSFPKPWIRGTKHGHCRLTDEQVSSLRSDRQRGMTFRAIGEKYGIAAPTAHGIVTYKRHKPDSFYKEVLHSSSA